LVVEAMRAPIEGWDFSWLEGRATEERPPWGYARLLAGRLAEASSVCDVDTGGGEVLAEALRSTERPPERVVATEAWRPNATRARERLSAAGASVVLAESSALPFPGATFDLVVSRHPADYDWDEIARVISPGGSYFAQHVGAASNHELSAFLLGPFEPAEDRSPDRAVAEAAAAGLEVTDLRTARCRVEYHDIGAVVYFLRLVVWTVPDFSVDRYRPGLEALDEYIASHGSFVSHSTRYLIAARRPTPT
jgi:Methyltransferase domain